MASLGGPGPSCSALRVRKLRAGELSGGEAARTEEHVAGCARCAGTERELERERARLAADVPFDGFAAGVAEKLARDAPAGLAAPRSWAGGNASWLRRTARWAPAAAAAALLLGVGGVALRQGRDEGGAGGVALRQGRDEGGAGGIASQQGRDEGGVRVKGGDARATVFVQDARGVHALAADERVGPSARLLVSLAPGARKNAAVLLVEPGETSVLYSGAALRGALPQAFEWTGAGAATVLVVLDDGPIDVPALQQGAQPARSADVIRIPLRR